MKKLLSMIMCFLLFLGSASAQLCVRLDEGALLLARDGTELLPLGVYEDIVPLPGGLYALKQDGAYALADAGGAPLTGFIYTYFEWCDGVLIGETGGMRGLLSPEGVSLSPFEYTSILPVGDGRFWAIREDGSDLESDELFLLDADGSETATGLFIRRMHVAGNGMLAVLRPVSGLWGYCNAVGEMVIPSRFSHAGAFSNGLAAVVENGMWGAIDERGEAIVPAQYDYLEICPGGFILAGLSQQGVWVFDAEGTETARYEGEETAAAPVGDGYAVYDGEKLTLYSAEGETIVQGGQGASISEGLDGQLILADGSWGEACVGIVGTQARYQNLYPLGYSRGRPIYACMEANSARYINDLLGEAQISVDMDSARYGVVDERGEMLLDAGYDAIFYLDDDRLLTRTGDYWQVCDTAGDIYWTHGVIPDEAPNS